MKYRYIWRDKKGHFAKSNSKGSRKYRLYVKDKEDKLKFYNKHYPLHLDILQKKKFSDYIKKYGKFEMVDSSGKKIDPIIEKLKQKFSLISRYKYAYSKSIPKKIQMITIWFLVYNENLGSSVLEIRFNWKPRGYQAWVNFLQSHKFYKILIGDENKKGIINSYMFDNKFVDLICWSIRDDIRPSDYRRKRSRRNKTVKKRKKQNVKNNRSRQRNL